MTLEAANTRPVALCLLGILVSSVCSAQSQQFSAEIVSADSAGDVVGMPGKLYVADRKARIETPDIANGYLIVDGAVPAAYLVWPAQRMFTEAKQSSRLSRLLVPLDSGNPCPEWEIMAVVAGIPDQRGQWHCDAQDRETVDGRSAMKFSVLSPRGHSAGWIDPQLGFPLKIETEDGLVVQLRDIWEGAQPASLFEIPASYRKFDVHRLFDRLKQSDVWVEPQQ